MRYTSLIYPLLTATFAVTASSQIYDTQRPLTDKPDSTMSAGDSSTTSLAGGDTIILSDVLGRDRSINIFAGFTRDIATMSQRFEDSTSNTTILAPVNSVIMALPRKPWEDPNDYNKLGANAYEGGDGQERAHANLRRFVEAHIIPASPWKEGEKIESLVGDEVWWEMKDGAKVIQPGNIEVTSVSKVRNGQLWILKGNNTGSIPIHQPVASRLTGGLIGAGGLLANHGAAPPPSVPLGAPSGPGNAFGGPLHSDTNRPIQHNPQNTSAQQQQHQMFSANALNHNPTPSNNQLGIPGGPGGPGGHYIGQQEAAARLQQMPFGAQVTPGHQIPGAPALGQGAQQPILNDALSYLDQVKVQFADQPDVYNRFLDIMKDFKSQAIDTPGVINRVSELFAGHPNLIQGFNTFLPPGYRIECGLGDNPNTIRVTTPMGTTVQSITGGRPLPDNAGPGAFTSRVGNWQQSIESPEMPFSPQNQNVGPPYGQSQAQQSSYDAHQAAVAAHQQQQRGVSQLTNAVATTLGQPPRNTQTPTPGGPVGTSGQAGMEKTRGPVEFNHAISYVNKIKNRFQDRPEIYKQFLEILQTYQRESKPIQDVYAQVTQLFNTAPDLLEDFKQFLPESAAQAKAAAAKAAEDMAAMSQTPQTSHGARGESKIPPMGNFAVPPSNSKDKKRPRNNPSGVSGSQGAGMGESASRSALPGGSSNNKRAKLHHKPNNADALIVSPTLTPSVPEPLSPHKLDPATAEELAFFDRVKKYIANKSTTNEFLKLCNLFSQDLISRHDLVHKVSNFIGGHLELMNWFKEFIGYKDPEVIVNQPRPPTDKVALSNCRGLGPSYRLLPKRERQKPCTGRDEMCLAVLNDEWASHPTWASEDSGFVAHRKNIFEEALHRIEEERHDYDFNIEANAKVIQLLEPVGQTLLSMSDDERAHFEMPLGLGGQSQAIYRRVLKKVYGLEKGPEVAVDLFKDPAAVLPIVLARLKAKDEEWRFSQREWEKVWHNQTQTMYLKSLDHMGIHIKQSDKKNLSAKHLVDSIKTKYEEQKRQQGSRNRPAKFQFSFDFDDKSVVLDVLRFMLIYTNNATQHNPLERRRICDFFIKFIPMFFDVSGDLVQERTKDTDRGSSEYEDEDITAETSAGRGRKQANGKKNDLRRGVLDKGRNGIRGRSQKEDSATGSKESTPDIDSIMEDDVEGAEDHASNEVTNETWLTKAGPTAVPGTKPLTDEELDLQADQPWKRDWYSLYCNQTIYVFFSIFHTLYKRFKDIRDSEDDVKAEIIRARSKKPATDIGLMEERIDYFSVESQETYYTRTLSLVEEYILGEVEEAKFQDFFRHYYLKKGWQLYTITDLLKILCRHAVTCSTIDTKEKTPDIIDQWYHSRESKENSYNTEINLRKQTDKYLKDGELFLIRWFPDQARATMKWVQKDETTFDLNDLERTQRWQYYTSSYVRIEPTEGVPRRLLRKSLLSRNLPSGDAEFEDGSGHRQALVFSEDLTLRICVNTYKIVYKDPGSEYFIYANTSLGGGADGETRKRLRQFEDARNQRFQEKFVMNNKWMKDLNHAEVQKVNQEFQTWIADGTLPGTVVPDAIIENA
ncbi:hypothetical protein B7494_g1534 [Chlorociboria aeruginascens]|nr:hypothetical protein B7494_g1534 [Chlorociboria aeruginascens]